MEVTREMTCPTPGCGSVMTVWEFGEPPVTVVSCTQCELDGVLGDDRLFSHAGIPTPEVRAVLKARADKLADLAKQAKGRYTEIKR